MQNGSGKKIGLWIAGATFAASLLLNVTTIVKATPSRDEVRAMNESQNTRLEFFITLIQEDIARMDGKLDKLIDRHIEGGGGN